MRKRNLAILGSTGSIGTQTLDVVSRHRELFDIDLLTANNNAELLIKQAIEFEPNNVVICNKDKYNIVADALKESNVKVFAGIESVNELVKSSSVDMVVAAMVGFSGLEPTINAIKASKVIALANKETLVAAGGIIVNLVKQNNSALLPVDSEHSAIFQCLKGEDAEVEKILLTASGGPFRTTPLSDLAKVTKQQALSHPNWNMGAKVTIDSATMMNKGLEMIEASWLFNLPPDKIEIVVHPQSIIHSMVQFSDGCLKAQLGAPDMRVPIQYALSYPTRLSLNTKRISFPQLQDLTFFAPDTERFPLIKTAYDAHAAGGNAACIMNAANEVAVKEFINDRIRFAQIAVLVDKTINKMMKNRFVNSPTVEDIFETDRVTKIIAKELVSAL